MNKEIVLDHLLKAFKSMKAYDPSKKEVYMDIMWHISEAYFLIDEKPNPWNHDGKRAEDCICAKREADKEEHSRKREEKYLADGYTKQIDENGQISYVKGDHIILIC